MRINVSVPDELAKQAEEKNLSCSAVLQDGLKAALDKLEKGPEKGYCYYCGKLRLGQHSQVPGVYPGVNGRSFVCFDCLKKREPLEGREIK